MAWKVMQGDVREKLAELPEKSVQCVVTSPPYWGLRDYGVDGQLGLEKTPEEYVANMVEVFRGVWRVLRDEGTVWLNLGDSYFGSSMTGGTNSIESSAKRKGRMFKKPSNYTPKQGKSQLKPKDLVGIPWRVAFALQADGWYLRSDIIWAKPNPMPESVTDRPTKAHEYIFLLSKSSKYYYDADSIREPLSEQRAKQAGKLVDPGNDAKKRKKQIEHDKKRGSGGHFDGHKWRMNPLGRNKRSVWTVATKPFPEAHFAVYPPALITPCILAGCPVGGTVLDPFAGSGTTLYVAEQYGRDSIGIELSEEYCKLIHKRMDKMQMNIFSLEVSE
jgi:DNA modification methylase